MFLSRLVYISTSIAYLLSLVFLLSLPGCDRGEFFTLSQQKERREKAAKRCEEFGGLQSPGPLYADGFYIEKFVHYAAGFGAVTTYFSKGRFKFFEVGAPSVFEGFSGPWYTHLIRGDGRYVRFYMADRGDPDCKAYEYFWNNNHNNTSNRSRTKTGYRGEGIYPDHCIAAIRTDKLLSEYTKTTLVETDPEIKDLKWVREVIKNLRTGEIYASYNSFRYCIKGRTAKGKCKGKSKDIFRCPVPTFTKEDSTKRAIEFRAIDSYHILKGTGNSVIEKAPQVVEIDEIPAIAVDRVEPELLEVLEGKENIRALVRDEATDVSQRSCDKEGYACFLGDGRYVHVMRDDRKALRIKINMPEPENKTGPLDNRYDYCCIRAVVGDGIYCMAWGGRNEFTEKANRFYVLKYDWDGKLVRITGGVLPFEFIRRGKIMQYYARLEIGEDAYTFSVIDVDERNERWGSFLHPHREYRFRLPFTEGE